jgi:hypothetical protein
MSAIVIDTNVLLVANGLAPQMSGACKIECLNRLDHAKQNEAVVVDRRYFILGEYQNKLNPNRRPPGPGDAFVKHILQNMKSNAHVSLVNLTSTNAQRTDFAEFPPDEALRAAFDPADRKFVAAANIHPEKPPILESADSKWLGWEADLLRNGIRLEVLCRCELVAIRKRKTDGEE